MKPQPLLSSGQGKAVMNPQGQLLLGKYQQRDLPPDAGNAAAKSTRNYRVPIKETHFCQSAALVFILDNFL